MDSALQPRADVRHTPSPPSAAAVPGATWRTSNEPRPPHSQSRPSLGRSRSSFNTWPPPRPVPSEGAPPTEDRLNSLTPQFDSSENIKSGGRAAVIDWGIVAREREAHELRSESSLPSDTSDVPRISVREMAAALNSNMSHSSRSTSIASSRAQSPQRHHSPARRSPSVPSCVPPAVPRPQRAASACKAGPRACTAPPAALIAASASLQAERSAVVSSSAGSPLLRLPPSLGHQSSRIAADMACAGAAGSSDAPLGSSRAAAAPAEAHSRPAAAVGGENGRPTFGSRTELLPSPREVASFPRGDAVAEERTASTGATMGEAKALRTAPALGELRARSSLYLGSHGQSRQASFSDV
ncbi:hypothetical protein AB1Y20_016134 [Prymnesium parvum]|uniref:Uncharacterized protein n=1 Tax=Prymnesium parvum TaxID=97485 RepID=A0AB34K513_PRYPA